MQKELKKSGGEAIRVIHITSLYSLLSILNSRNFIPAYSNREAGDAGMNLLMPEGDKFGNKFEGTGVKIVLEWNGPLRKSNDAKWPLKPNVLHDLLPHRLFIPIGTEKITPLIKRVSIDKSLLHQHCEIDKWYLPRNIKSQLERKARYKLIKKIRRTLNDKNCFISITARK